MTGIPTWLAGSAITIVKTFNGYAIVQSPASAASESVAFETWAALAYYLNANFATA
ncbi:MAG TPA: hypothetical protein VM621_10545 [Luteibacter sp.]|uniref:hypothetical protein n=1 Tax=Luteibacter sp. TaxID=1886636 RepID=UPI002BBBD301|nr:hypothetical protein [Luteibacter sp.]HVI55476.1 hypothetical protein [Luteibacter sp.]